MAIVWHTGQLVSTGTNLTSEMRPSNEMTVTEENEDPWKKSYTVLPQWEKSWRASLHFQRVLLTFTSLEQFLFPWLGNTSLGGVAMLLQIQPSGKRIWLKNLVGKDTRLRGKIWIIRNEGTDSLSYELSWDALLTVMFRETLISHLDNMQYFLQYFVV